jgi:hypothetical protein
MTTTQIGKLKKRKPYPSSLSNYHNYCIIMRYFNSTKNHSSALVMVKHYITESTATCPHKVVTKATRRRVTLQQKQPLKMVEGIDRNM